MSSALQEVVRTALGAVVEPGQRLLIAASGGADSQALVHLCASLRAELGLSIVAAGIDHGLRAKAGAELDHAQQLATSLDIDFVRRAVQLPAAGNRLAAARRARYAALSQIRSDVGADWILTAHSATDQAETVLMRIARGTGVRGVGGMGRRRGRLLRPLLDVERDKLRRYAEEHQLPFADDPGNADLRRARPRVRHNVLPELTALNPSAIANLGQLADDARSDDAWLRRRARGALDQALGALGSLDVDAVVRLDAPLRRRALEGWLGLHRLPALRRHRHAVDTVLDGGPPTTLGRRAVRVDGGRLWIEHPAHTEARILPVPGELAMPDIGLRLRARVTDGRAPTPKNDRVGVAFDAAGLHLALQVRPWQDGDAMQPFGLDGHVKVSDVFGEAKMPRLLRRHWPLLLHGDDVLWAVGLRRGANAPLTSSTGRAVWIELVGALPWDA